MSPPKKTIGRDPTQIRPGTSKETSHGSSSSLNLNSWDGIIEDSFDDVSNHNLPFSQEVGSGSNHEITGTGDVPKLLSPSHQTGPAGYPLGSDFPKSVLRAGSKNNPIHLKSTPEDLSPPVDYQPRPSRPRRIVPLQILR